MVQDASLFTDQSPNDLFLSLVEGELDVEPYNVLWSETAAICGLTVTGRVIGASHIISYGTDDTVLHEMLACVTPPSDLDSFQMQIGDQARHDIERQTAKLRYSFKSRRVPWDAYEQSTLKVLIRQTEGKIPNGFGVAYEFPQGDLPAIPMTVVLGRASWNYKAVAISTAHSYPGQAVVYSHSVISTVKTQGA